MPIMFNQFVPILLQAPAGGGGLFGLLLPMVLIFVLFYFMIILPQRKRQKAVDEMLNNLKPGDRVVTSGGVYGSIVSIREDKRTVQLTHLRKPGCSHRDRPQLHLPVCRRAGKRQNSE
jgi:preprotein translocase subunit YajC